MPKYIIFALLSSWVGSIDKNLISLLKFKFKKFFKNKYPENLFTFLPLKTLKSIQKKPLSKIATSDFINDSW